jgi:hypothetical protein
MILAQVLNWISTSHLESLDHTSGTGRPSRRLSRWRQVGAFVVAPLAGRHRRRDVVRSRAAHAQALAPVGLTPPQRSTLAEAHERRPAARSHAIVATLYARGRAVAPGHRCRGNSPLSSLDRTPIARGGSLFPWARFRQAQGALKRPTRLDQAGHLPAWVLLTAGTRRALAGARGLKLPQGSIVAMDRGDIDARLLGRLTPDGVSVVTRQQVNRRVTVTARCAVDGHRGWPSDHHVVLWGQKAKAAPTVWRRVGDRDPDTGTPDVVWTTAFQVGAATVAALDQQRWPSALFCNAIQQHLQLQTCLGTAETAVMTHLWVALSTDLLLACLRFKAGLGISFQPMLRLLHINRFARRNLLDLCPPQPCDDASGQL